MNSDNDLDLPRDGEERLSAAELCKRDHRSFFRALQADCKTHPGGTTGLAEEMKVNNTTLANQICPNNSTSPPSLARLFEIIMLTGGRRTVPAICRLNSTTPLPITLRPKTPLESIRCFMAFTRQMGEALNKGSEFAEDLKFSASEREQLLPILLDGQKAILELIQSLEG